MINLEIDKEYTLFSINSVYSPDMPKRLPIKDIMSVLLRCLFTAARYWFQYTLVAAAWLGLIPLTACMCGINV